MLFIKDYHDHHGRSDGQAGIGGIRNAYKILVGRPAEQRTFGRPRSRWEHKIKTK
jgi:hypothetical protein